MSETTQWSTDWSGSTDPSKQRKYRENAPHHHRKRFLNAHLADSVRETVETRAVPLVTGDQVEVMRGDHAGAEGRVDDIDTEEQKVYVDGVEREAVDGSDTAIPVRPSNLKITKLNLEDERRLAKYEVSEEEKEEISIEPEEAEDEEEPGEEPPEEAEEPADDAAEDVEDVEELLEESAPAEIVEGTVDEVKEAVRDGAADPAAVLEAETANKDRVTLVEWLESRVDEGGSDE